MKVLINSQSKVISVGGQVTGIDASIDPNIVPGNIKKGVDILGVSGSVVEGATETYKITWLDYDGTVLRVDNSVEVGETVSAPAVPAHQYLKFEEWVHGNSMVGIDQDYFNIARHSYSGESIHPVRKVDAPAGQEVWIRVTKPVQNCTVWADWGDGRITALTSATNLWDASGSHQYSQSFQGYIHLSASVSGNCKMPRNANFVETYITEYYIPSASNFPSSPYDYMQMGNGNSSLKAVVFPNDMTVLPRGTFMNYSPKVVALPSGTTAIGYTNSSTQGSIIQSRLSGQGSQYINIPSTVTEIGNSALDAQYEMKGITKDIYATTIGVNAFRYCGRDTSQKTNYASGVGKLKCLGNISTLGGGAFCYSGFDEIDISTGSYTTLANMNGGMFSDNRVVKKIKLSNSVTTIGTNCFYPCPLLEEIEGLGTGVTSVAENAFRECRKLITPININLASGSAGRGGLFVECWNMPSINIGNNLTDIVNFNGGFYSNCRAITSLQLPSALTTIGNASISYLYSLTGSIDLSTSSITTIGNYFLQACTGIEEVYLPQNCAVGQYFLQACLRLRKLHIRLGDTFNASNFMENCNSLEEVTCDEGFIPNVNLNFSASKKITAESMVQFFTNLGTTGTSRTLTFGAWNLAKLSAADKAIATDKGYILA